MFFEKSHYFVKSFSRCFLLFALAFCCVNLDEKNVFDESSLIEQSCFAGFYVQNKTYGDGGDAEAAPYALGIAAYNLSSRNYVFDNGTDDEQAIENGFYSRDFHDYDFVDYSESKYQNAISGNGMDGTAWGPKDSPANSTCKVRAYYHDVEFNNDLVTLMFDFTGFLVGDSLLMTAAHGLYRDVTVDAFDDGIDNKYFPGKVEVYGAIGMSDSWGSSYEYYSKGTTIFMSTYYMTYRSFAYDWAVIRLDRPLGRELSYRKLSTPMDYSGNYWIIGYPSYNQFHLRLQVSNANYVINSTGPIYEYNVSSVDGMSGSPFYLDNIEDFEYDSNGKPYLACRAAYGMHVCSSADYTFGYAMTFYSDIVNLVDTLNNHCYPEDFEINFSEMTNQDLEDACVTFCGEYDCDITSSNCSFSNGNIIMSPTISGNSSLTISFPFPAYNIMVRPSSLQQMFPNINVESVYCSQQPSNQTLTSYYNGVYEICDSYVKEIIIDFDYNPSIPSLYLEKISFSVEWDYIPGSTNAPDIDYDTFDSPIVGENCVSYALLGINNFSGGTVLPKDSNGNVLNFSRDLFPARIISGLKRSLLLLNIEMEEIGKYDACELDAYKIAIFCDPYHYYHVIRQNKYGAWSHYLIGNDPSYLDTSGDYITNPNIARFVNAIDYSLPSQETYFDTCSFVGYFSIRGIDNE